MTMPVMQIRVMDMLVPHRLVLVPMRMRFAHGSVVAMLVVLVVDVTVLVFERLVIVFVLVAFRKV